MLRGIKHGRRGNVFVACSTLCFGKYPLEQALRKIDELRFAKVDLAIHEEGTHLKPSHVACDVNRTANFLRGVCSLGVAAFHVHIHGEAEEHLRQLRAVCRLARLTTVPVVSISAPPATTDVNTAVHELTEKVKIARGDGVILAIDTEIGTLAETPETTVELCERVPGLGVALDPSHYLVGPARGRSFDDVYPYVRHVRLRDTGATPNEFQVRVGQGQIDYGRVISLLERYHYDRLLSVDIRDIPDGPYPMEPEVRKLKYLLESLV
jgi:sugar phosphate isomerase/epimerase